MIKCYFGVPGVGKSTILVKEYLKNKKKYDHIYTINLDIKGVPKIEKEVLEKYKMYNTLILWDEITLDHDNRAFKTFPKGTLEFIVMHRHLGTDIIYATQNFENVDKKIRDLTSELWYMEKSVVPLFRKFTRSRRIYRTININELNSELTLGYRYCQGLEKFFASNLKIDYRPKYYKYFNTKEEGKLEGRKIYEEISDNSNNFINNEYR